MILLNRNRHSTSSTDIPVLPPHQLTNIELVLGLFGAEKLWVHPDYALDHSREFDGQVKAAIKQRVERLGEGEKLRCLEVGAGSTYEFDGGHLYRDIARMYGGRVDLTVTDLCAGLKLVLVDEKKNAYIGGIEAACEANSLVSKLCCDTAGRCACLPLSFDQIQASYGAKALQRVLEYFRQYAKVGPERGLLFVRPALDAEVERHLAGITVRTGVDYLNLISSFPKRRFDFIFGRYLSGWSYQDQGEEVLADSLRSVLAPRGAASLGFEATTFISGGSSSREWQVQVRRAAGD